MSKKRLVIIFGGTVDSYRKGPRFFDAFEKRFKTVVRRTKEFKLNSKIKNVDVDFFVCINPKNDRSYKSLRNYFEINKKKLCPPSAEALCKKIKKANCVLFFGSCGAFRGKVGEMFVPNEFYEIDFPRGKIIEKTIKTIKPINKITSKNILSKLKSKPSKVITSNKTLMTKNIENESEKELIKLSRRLMNYAEVVEKESYQIVKHFRNNCPVGVLLIASDVVSNKKEMLKTDEKDLEKRTSEGLKDFNKRTMKAIEIALEKLK